VPEAADTRAPAVRGGRETVLIVEDEQAVARMASLVLERQGYRVLLAEDGQSALALLEAVDCEPDLLVTDVVMPNIGGPELAERLRVTRPALRVLFTSGYSYDGMGQKGELDPGTAFLQKPFTPAALARAVRDVLDKGLV
jgi:CheY-like chemotaxis protein